MYGLAERIKKYTNDFYCATFITDIENAKGITISLLKTYIY